MISSEMIPQNAVTVDALALENSPILDAHIAPSDSFYTWQEDIANSLTHALGILLSLVGMAYLVLQAEHTYAVVALTIYGLSSALLYTASTAYHFVQQPVIKQRLRQIDHGSIYLLIAGSYTPYLTIGLSSNRSLLLLGAVWSAAMMGVGFKFFSPDPYRYEKYSLASYIGLGWIIVLILPEMMQSMDPTAITWLVLGGLSYMVGIPFYKWETMPYNHAIWHLFVLGGSICHFLSILTFAVPL